MNTKNNLVKFDAVIIRDTDYNEYDKLLTLLTKDIGKIKAYAFNIRKTKSKNIGKVRLFTFGTFELRKNNDNYQLENVVLKDSFDEITLDYRRTYFATYFIELADYFGMENVESEEIYKLLYYSFKALLNEKIPMELIIRIYELKMLKYEGIYKDSTMLSVDNSTLKYTWDFVINTVPEKLYTFKLSDEIFSLFNREVVNEMREKVGKKFKSLEEINKML